MNLESYFMVGYNVETFAAKALPFEAVGERVLWEMSAFS